MELFSHILLPSFVDGFNGSSHTFVRKTRIVFMMCSDHPISE